MQYLNQIASPDDIKNMKVAELKTLAQEIRQEIIEVVSKNGGHLAPNLGVVESDPCVACCISHAGR